MGTPSAGRRDDLDNFLMQYITYPLRSAKSRVRKRAGAMRLLERTQGGNGLREGGTFERRYRDFRAMPLHINVHQDRVTHQLGRFVLDIERDPF